MVAINKIHKTALSLAAMRYKLGQYDAAFHSVIEAIKIAQNKNDSASILECSVWLQHISSALGNRH